MSSLIFESSLAVNEDELRCLTFARLRLGSVTPAESSVSEAFSRALFCPRVTQKGAKTGLGGSMSKKR